MTASPRDAKPGPSQALPSAPVAPVRYGPYLLMPAGYMSVAETPKRVSLLTAEEFQSLMAVASGGEPVDNPPH